MIPPGPAEHAAQRRQLLDLRARTERAAPDFVGLTEAEAVGLADRLGLTVRFRHVDLPQWHASEDRAGRVTADVRHEVVIEAAAG